MINETQQLSERERQILYLVASGRSNQQIANELGISINTVKVHLRNVFGKIGAASRTEASMYAVRTGIITVDRAVATPASVVGDEPPVPDVGAAPVQQIPDAAPALLEDDANLEAVVPSQAVEPSLTPPSLIVESSVTLPSPTVEPPPLTLPSPVDVSDPQQTVVAPAVEHAPEQAKASSSRRSMHLFPLVIISLLVVTLAGLAVAWFLPSNDPVNDQTQAGDTASINLSRWRELAAIPTSRAGFAMATVDEQLFVMAGENETGVLNTVQRYDPRSEEWVELAQKPTPVADVRTGKLGDKLYIPGGRRSADPKDISAAFERYDPRTDSWEKLADLPQPRSGYALAALEGKLYVFGGWDGTAYRDEVFAYDPGANSWSELEAMPTARAFADAAVIESSIFVVGGENKAGPVASNEQYLPSQEDTQPWVNGSPMPQPRSRFSTAVALSNIYVFGGDAAPDSLQYDARTERWQTFDAPAVIGSQPGVTLLDEMIMIVGGKSGPGMYSTQMYSYQALFRTMLPNSQ